MALSQSLLLARGNANRIFNAIHSAMRQWGSSIHHNGMSFFPATIPVGVLLYHGGHQADAVTGMEWLAFEIEHAEMFAHPIPKQPPDDPQHLQRALRRQIQDQSPLVRQSDDEDSDSPFLDGYLHTYRVTRPQRMLYIDGMSAAKSMLGTLDSQDELLRNHTGKGGFDEWPRAEALCDLAQAWRIDGIIRMEAGFEVIKCNFSDGLALVSATQRPWRGADWADLALDHMEYMRAVSQRYGDITASRVTVDYSRMVSALFYPVNLTNPEARSPELPRMVSVPWEALAVIKNDVAEAITASWQKAYPVATNWQGVTDMVVSRYADRLRFIAERAALEDVRADVNGLLDTFIDYADAEPDMAAATRRCTQHYLDSVHSETWQAEVIRAGLEEVTSRICTDLFAVRAIVSENDEEVRGDRLVRARTVVWDLMVWLEWAEWRTCGTCESDQVCFVAIWPYGDVEDHFSPSCLNKTQMQGRHGYWGFGRK
jgi:hypothetical protein